MKLGIRLIAGLVGLVFIFAGATKLIAEPSTIDGFTRFGLPAWFMYFIGLSEIAGGIVLQIPKFARYAAAGLLLIMCGAVMSHLLTDPIQKTAPAMVLWVFLGLLYWGFRKISVRQLDRPKRL